MNIITSVGLLALRTYLAYSVMRTTLEIGTSIWARNTEAGKVCLKYHYARNYKALLTESQVKETGSIGTHRINVANTSEPPRGSWFVRRAY